MTPHPSLLVALLLAGCLERSTGEKKELPQEYLEQIEEGGESKKIAGVGPTVKVSGIAKGIDGIPVDIDIAYPDPEVQGGMARLGKVVIDTPGPFEVELPQGKEKVYLAFFQDMDGDGPDSDDTYHRLELTTGTEPVADLAVELVLGAYEGPVPMPGGGEHMEAPPGAPGGGDGPGGGPTPVASPGGEHVEVGHDPTRQHVEVPGGDGQPDPASATAKPHVERLPAGAQPFGGIDGPKVTVRGAVTADRDLPVDLEVRLLDHASGATGKLLMTTPGKFDLLVPRNSATVRLEAFQDMAGDGPSALDPVASVEVEVGEIDVDGVALALVVSGMAGGAADAAPVEGDPAQHSDMVHVEVAPGEGGGAAPTPEVVVVVGPFDDHEGPTVVLSGDVQADPGVPIDLDLRVRDNTAASGVRDLGKLILAEPGPFSVKVPKGFGELTLEGFQDPGDDGPDAADPWGSRVVEVGDEDLVGVHLVLVAGARGSGAEHHEVPHSEAQAGATQAVDLSLVDKPVSAGGIGPFANHRGSFVKLRGQVRAERDLPVDLDVWVEDPTAPGGMRNQGKVVLVRPSEFVLRVPKGAGKIAIEAYQDEDVDGPTEADAFDRVEVAVGTTDPAEVTLSLRLTGAAARGGAGPGPGAAGGGGAAPPPDARPPFSDYAGPTITLSGVVRADQDGVVDIDVRVPDADAPGGMRQEGKLKLAGPGVFELKVPADHGAVELEAFQDGDQDGPDDEDPYGRLRVEVGSRDLQAALDLVPGGRAIEAAKGAAPGGGGAGGGGGGGQADAFPSYQGERVTISGVVKYSGEGMVDLDLFKNDPSSPGGRTIAGKLKVRSGAFSFTAPKDFGDMDIEAFVDLQGDGPSASDPVGRYVSNPLKVGSKDLQGIEIVIEGG